MDKKAVEGRWVGLRNQSSDGTIDFLLTSTRFDLNRLSTNAPTGEEGPPPAVQEGENTFYHCGAGGGGVEYPDQFFYNFDGKLLSIVFDGPYEGKSPTDETKEIESKMLASFRIFAPKRIRQRRADERHKENRCGGIAGGWDAGCWYRRPGKR